MINVSGLRKLYGDLVAVDGLTFDVPRGEVFGLLGPNGAGKTTTLHMLVGAIAPDGGEVSIGDGGKPTDAQVRRQIGHAPQALAIYDELTGDENATFFGKLYGLSGKDLKGRVDSVLELVGLVYQQPVQTAALLVFSVLCVWKLRVLGFRQEAPSDL
jgi:ABC-2 type transport system ATP-binding protein